MFKSKVDFNAFDKHNTKVEQPVFLKQKSVTKNNIQKLAKQEEEKTMYHLVLNYFEDASGKAIAHFFDLGINKKMQKHFAQVEMKTGKLDKRSSKTPKEASAGMAYVKTIDQVPYLHLEPSPDSKIPKGKWQKISKGLKPYLSGMKIMVILEGETIEEDVQDETPLTESTAPESSTDTNNDGIQTIKTLITSISAVLKDQLPKSVIPNLKAKTATQEDRDTMDGLWTNIEALRTAYEAASTDIQTKIAKHYNMVMGQAPKLAKVKAALAALTGSSEEDLSELTKVDESDPEAVKALKELLAKLEEEMNAFDRNFSILYNSISSASEQMIASGEALLAALF